jgi:hypothetical protein
VISEPNEAWKQLGQRVFAVPSSQDGAESGQSAAAESSASSALPVAWNAPRIVVNPEHTPPLPNAVRFVCISDTHNKDATLRLPRGHVLLHAGDFSNVGLPKEVEAFAQWLASQDGFAHKIVIAGNHDLPFDAVGYAGRAARFRHPRGVDPQVFSSIFSLFLLYLIFSYLILICLGTMRTVASTLPRWSGIRSSRLATACSISRTAAQL